MWTLHDNSTQDEKQFAKPILDGPIKARQLYLCRRFLIALEKEKLSKILNPKLYCTSEDLYIKLHGRTLGIDYLQSKAYSRHQKLKDKRRLTFLSTLIDTDVFLIIILFN